MPPTSKATTNQELKESAVLLESKIQALFGNSRNVEKEKFDTTPEIKPTVNSEEKVDLIILSGDLIAHGLAIPFNNNGDTSSELEE